MDIKKYDFTIIGGDMRQVYMCDLLINRNYSTSVYGLDNNLLNNNCHHCETLEEAIESSDKILVPIPFSKDGDTILSNTSYPDMTVKNFCSKLTPNHLIFGGCIPEYVKTFCFRHNIFNFDFMEDEDLTMYNTISTAEGTIAEAINRSTINLHQSNCLILGYGRCAQSLAVKLRGLGAMVTIAARNPKSLISAKTQGYNSINLSYTFKYISYFPFIFNTIPSLILNERLLERAKKDVTIIDIASYPGGVDYEISEKLGINASLCLGLPGKYSPKYSANLLVDTIESIIKERSD